MHVLKKERYPIFWVGNVEIKKGKNTPRLACDGEEVCYSDYSLKMLRLVALSPYSGFAIEMCNIQVHCHMDQVKSYNHVKSHTEISQVPFEMLFVSEFIVCNPPTLLKIMSWPVVHTVKCSSCQLYCYHCKDAILIFIIFSTRLLFWFGVCSFCFVLLPWYICSVTTCEVPFLFRK